MNLDYFTKEDGFVKSLVPQLPDGAGIAWVFGLMTAKDSAGHERLLAGYSTHNPGLSAFGIVAFNDNIKEFEQIVQFPSKDDWRHPGGQDYVEIVLDGIARWPFAALAFGRMP